MRVRDAVCVRDTVCVARSLRGIQFARSILQFAQSMLQFARPMLQFVRSMIQFARSILQFAQSMIQFAGYAHAHDRKGGRNRPISQELDGRFNTLGPI